ncbi:MAG: hypothetical protein QOD02_5386 [Mycobacterium sp.]|jgi:hypothetical protein|nr:hypothetical protein [Mycobacterium sp.]
MDPKTVSRSFGRVLATPLADLLQVSKQAARIRLDSEGLIARD